MIYLFGSNGMLGNYIKKYFKKYNIVSYTRNDYDINMLTYNNLNLFFENNNIKKDDIIINCAGVIPQRNKNNIDYYNANTIFPLLLNKICEIKNIKLIHITTDCVYSGKKGNYNENDKHDETNIYGISKSLGENCNSTIIRTSIIGEEIHNKASLLEWVLKNKNNIINGYTNHYWNGITCLELSKIIEKIIINNLYWKGVRHIYSPNIVTKYELINYINDIYKCNITIKKYKTDKDINKSLNSLYDTNNIFEIKDIKLQIKELYDYSKCKNIITISGIRPDFIRMSEIFKKLDNDKEINHTLIHTGQHYDELLSGIFFKELNIRKPDYILNTGKQGGKHYNQLAYLSEAIIELIDKEKLLPDIILFLGDSNTVCASLPLKKEGYKIGHIEAGMRSFDKRMLEETNRTICDHCSDIFFVYHKEYKKFLENENIKDNIHIVGNTIVEVCNPYIPKDIKQNNMILLDIHRPENFKYKERMENIIEYANICINKYNIPVKMLNFGRTTNFINEYKIDLGKIDLIDLMGYKEYLKCVYHCKFIISDSGTAQEEPALLNTPVIVPRDFTERPQSVDNNCSFMLDINSKIYFEDSWQWLSKIENKELTMNIKWLGEGNTSDLVINHLKKYI